ncbi:hypothetical protein [Pararhizobium sp. A13]|uniref:hypothetical protein n=1 Tax=Pararhizobium sp. A13 TaxID=3133975 RepID=UPI003246D323
MLSQGDGLFLRELDPVFKADLQSLEIQPCLAFALSPCEEARFKMRNAFALGGCTLSRSLQAMSGVSLDDAAFRRAGPKDMH